MPGIKFTLGPAAGRTRVPGMTSQRSRPLVFIDSRTWAGRGCNVFFRDGELHGSGADRKHRGSDRLVGGHEARCARPAVRLVSPAVRGATAGGGFSLAGPRRTHTGGAA